MWTNICSQQHHRLVPAYSALNNINKDQSRLRFRYFLLSVPGMNLLECTICNKNYSSISKLKRHKLIHTETKDFKCHCGAEFHRNDQLTRHKKTHLKEPKTEKLYHCTECPKIFKSNQNLKIHVNKHFELKFKCIKCNEFINKVDLNSHIRKHNLECNICSKPFKTKRSLEYHLKIHKNEREIISCPECLKVFYTKFALKNHQKVKHLGIKDYECVQCSKKFGYKSVLLKHQKICGTVVEKPTLISTLINGYNPKPRNHECYFTNCDAKFERAYDLDRHIKAMHSNDSDCDTCLSDRESS